MATVDAAFFAVSLTLLTVLPAVAEFLRSGDDSIGSQINLKRLSSSFVLLAVSAGVFGVATCAAVVGLWLEPRYLVPLTLLLSLLGLLILVFSVTRIAIAVGRSTLR